MKISSEIIAKLLSFKRILMGYSGGLDSTVLLHWLNHQPQLVNKTKIAIHIHHGLSPNADNWQQHCQETCQTLGIKCIARSVNLDKNSGESLENLARQARYQVFEALMQKGDVLVTAHHLDDQAETFLLQLIRGAGIKGLAAMPISKPLGRGILLRPLLNYSRAELAAYAKKHQLNWIEDESNQNIDFDRNYLRHKIMPLLKKQWQSIAETITRSAEHHVEAQEILNAQAAQDLVAVQRAIDQLSIDQLQKLSSSRQKNLLRYWIERNNFGLPSEAVLEQIVQQGLYAKKDAEPCISWANVDVRRYDNTLYIMPKLSEFDASQILPWQNQYNIPGLDIQQLQGKLTIQFRQGGERFHPANRSKSQTLKKLMQEWKIPTWLRDRTPLLYLDDQLIAVIGYAVAYDR